MFAKPISLASLALAAVAWEDQPAAADDFARAALPQLALSALQVNPTNDFRTIVEADERSGLSQISELLVQSAYEEQWAFIPSAGLWIEVGMAERADTTESEVVLDTEHLRLLAETYDEIVLVHFHPAAFFQVTEVLRLPAFTRPTALWKQDELAALSLSLPSADDILATFRIGAEIHSLSPGTSIRHMVVSPYGAVSFGPTERAIRQTLFETGHPRQSLERDVTQAYSIFRYPRNFGRFATHPNLKTVEAVLMAFCNRHSNEDFQMTFRPIDQADSSKTDVVIVD